MSQISRVSTVLLILCSACPTVRGADAARPAWTTSKLTGTPTPPPPYAIRPAFPKLSFIKPTSLEELPDGRMLVSEFAGQLYTFKKDTQTDQKDSLLTIDGALVWHATVHPKFQSNGLLFVCYSKDGTSHVSKFRVTGSPPLAKASSEDVLLTWPAGGHNGGCLQFGTDGMLYVSTGDGSGPNPPDGLTAAQDVSNLFGCVLRIDVDQHDDGQKYAVPADNPFVDLEGARPEIWAYGLRNPWKFSVDPKTGNIFAADNGWESWEMVHRIVRGGNCGWPIMEGRAILRSEVKRGPTPIRPPVKDHSHTEANSVIGGPVYRGSKLPGLNGTFVYGDYITGTIWGLTKTDGAETYSHQTLVDTDQRITAFAEGSAGELFVVDYDYTGQIYELVPSGLEDHSADFPRLLSETGLFTSLKQMTPAPGVVPYDVVVERWMDGTATQRWVAIPGNRTIGLAATDQSAAYPDGTVFVKHVTLKKSPVETQLLHYENGTWHPYSYYWPSDLDGPGDDAVLIGAAGEDKLIVRGRDRSGQPIGPTWHVNAENECRMCHNAGSGFVLGFVADQLDRLAGRTRPSAPQLATLAAQGVIASRPNLADNRSGRLVPPHDETQSLDDRARSYLHGNCSSCHHPGGNAIVSFYLRRDLPFDELKTNKGTGIGTFGMRNAKLIVPGDPYRSVLMYRMSKLGYGRMPYIGSHVVDRRGITLIEEWIRSMPHNDSPDDSALVRSGTPEARALAQITAEQKPGPQQVRDAAAVLLKSTEGALALIAATHAGAIDTQSARQAYTSAPSDIRGLLETFVPGMQRRKSLGRNIDPQTILSLAGNSDRGQLIFFSDGARCRNCHHLDAAMKSTGPTLTEIRKKYKRQSELLQHVLKPSLKVDEKFATWTVVTESGKVFNGLLLSQTDDEVVLKTVERKTIHIPQSEIDTLQKSPLSLMPAAILSDLTAQEAADLLQWFGAF